MVITTQKSKDKILEMLAGFKKVFLIGCGECATTCKTGGEREILALKEMIEAGGREVSGFAVPDAPCIAAQVKMVFARNRDNINAADIILVASCGLGVQSVKENSRVDKEFLPVCDTKFIAAVDSGNRFKEHCSACGECLLGETSAICPITRCAKGLLNGPCGGMENGKCEVDRQRDCAWVMIYQELERKGRVDLMRRIKKAKDYSKLNKPRVLALEGA